MLEYLFSFYIHYKFVNLIFSLILEDEKFKNSKASKEVSTELYAVLFLTYMFALILILIHVLVSGALFMWGVNHAGILPQITLQQGFVLDGLITMFIPTSTWMLNNKK